MHALVDILEALTIGCFGISWPISIRKSLVSRTAKGKSLSFEVLVLIGYAFGIVRKIIQFSMVEADWLFFLSGIFYVLNFIMISFDICLYFRNAKLDRERDAKGE